LPYTSHQWLETGTWFLYRGHRIFYRIEGNGQPLILLHGFPTSSWDWHRLWDSLRNSYQLIALDFIGYGFSDKPRNYTYSIDDQATLLEHLLAHLKIGTYHLLSHDVGDTVAQELLARQLDRSEHRILSVCLLNGGLFPETHRATAMQKLLLSRIGFIVARLSTSKRFVASFSILFPVATRPTVDEMRELYSLITYKSGTKIMHRLIKYIIERRENRSRWVGALQKANCPIRLIDGLEDPVSGKHMVERYRELIPQADVVELAGCGHYPQLEKPEDVLNKYAEFRKGILD
jgi:pimeloyl-ACP methyl ester carboxylesterase